MNNYNDPEILAVLGVGDADELEMEGLEEEYDRLASDKRVKELNDRMFEQIRHEREYERRQAAIRRVAERRLEERRQQRIEAARAAAKRAIEKQRAIEAEAERRHRDMFRRWHRGE